MNIAPLPQALRDALSAAQDGHSDRPHTDQDVPAPTLATEITPCGRAALNGEIEKIKAVQSGDRNDRLNKIAVKIGSLIGGGQVPFDVGTREFLEHALDTGHDPENVEDMAVRSIKFGMQNPRMPQQSRKSIGMRKQQQELSHAGTREKGADGGDDHRPVGTPPAPQIDGSAGPDTQTGPMFYGLLGDAVRALEPHTESDPNGLMILALAEFGNAVGANPHVYLDSAQHGTRLFVILVGDTARGRKGTAQSTINRLMRQADPDWWQEAKTTGLSSGEGLIAATTATPSTQPQPQTVMANGNRVQIAAPSIKRVLSVESELSRTLTALKRDSNTLSEVVREAWDGTYLSIMTKVAVKGNGHITIIGHITPDALAEKYSLVEISNGFMNRFLYARVHRSKLLPRGGDPSDVMDHFAPKIADALVRARSIGRMTRTADAEDLWERLYFKWDKDGSDLSARAAPYVMRIAMVYALVDGTSQIGTAHLEAANDVWEYNLRSIKRLGGSLNGAVGKLAKRFQEAAPNPLTAKDVAAAFSNNLKVAQTNEMLDELIALDYIEEYEDPNRKGTVGRRPRTWRWRG